MSQQSNQLVNEALKGDLKAVSDLRTYIEECEMLLTHLVTLAKEMDTRLRALGVDMSKEFANAPESNDDPTKLN